MSVCPTCGSSMESTYTLLRKDGVRIAALDPEPCIVAGGGPYQFFTHNAGAGDDYYFLSEGTCGMRVTPWPMASRALAIIEAEGIFRDPSNREKLALEVAAALSPKEDVPGGE